MHGKYYLIGACAGQISLWCNDFPLAQAGMRDERQHRCRQSGDSILRQLIALQAQLIGLLGLSRTFGGAPSNSRKPLCVGALSGSEKRFPGTVPFALQQRLDAKPMRVFINATVSGGFWYPQRRMESADLYASRIGHAWHGLRSIGGTPPREGHTATCEEDEGAASAPPGKVCTTYRADVGGDRLNHLRHERSC